MSRVLDKRCQPDFELLLVGVDLDRVEMSEASAFGLRGDFTLAYFNPAWFRFATENGAPDIGERWGLGASILDAVDVQLQPFYLRAYRDCIATGREWLHDYECSSPESFRRFQMQVTRLGCGAGLLVVNAPLVERPHDAARRISREPDDGIYRNRHGMIDVCVHCRRVQRADGGGQWDWVPGWVVESPTKCSGGLCPVCFELHYGKYRQG